MTDPELCVKSSSIAKKCLVTFVKGFVEIYGEHFVSANVHGLIHLADEALLHGALDSFAAFKFESFFGKVQKYIQGQKDPLQ